MNGSYTPGPWKIRPHWSNEYAFEIYPDRGDPGYGEWASIVEVGDGCYEDEAEANARLIAAAPDMYDFVQWILSLKTGGMIEGKARALIDQVEEGL